MSTRSFRSVFMVASCAGAALGCYLVSLRVASERAALEDVETKIVLAQLERWNVRVLALSAPSADQFLNGSFELARLAQPEHKVNFQEPVVLASAPQPEQRLSPENETTDAATVPAAAGPAQMLHQASLKTETREVPARPVATELPAAGPKSTERLAAAAKPVEKKSVDKPGLAAAQPVTKPVRIAKNDPLAPLPDSHSSKPPKVPAPTQ
jgi:hypothetical protein